MGSPVLDGSIPYFSSSLQPTVSSYRAWFERGGGCGWLVCFVGFFFLLHFIRCLCCIFNTVNDVTIGLKKKIITVDEQVKTTMAK